MVPGVQKVGVVHSIDQQGPKKCESEGAENGPFPHTNVITRKSAPCRLPGVGLIWGKGDGGD